MSPNSRRNLIEVPNGIVVYVHLSVLPQFQFIRLVHWSQRLPNSGAGKHRLFGFYYSHKISHSRKNVIRAGAPPIEACPSRQMVRTRTTVPCLSGRMQRRPELDVRQPGSKSARHRQSAQRLVFAEVLRRPVWQAA